MPTEEPNLAVALRRQAEACEVLGSAQYALLIRALVADFEAGGPTADLLEGRTDQPLRDAITLRLLAAVHRIVLRGDAPGLADRYASVGGDNGPIDVQRFLDVVAEHHDEVVEALGQNVQTNEVARCAGLVPAFADVARSTRLPLTMLEVGASGGLLSNWDRYRYECPGSAYGDPASAVRLFHNWADPFDLSGITEIGSRRACDVSPLDVSDPAARQRLLSFVWPDQRERFATLSGALDVALDHAIDVERADAGEWIGAHLPTRGTGTATIVFHSIVWQYLARDTKDRLRSVLEHEGNRATTDRPIAWVRLEPAGERADVRVTNWPGGTERIIATCSYHGADVRLPG